MTDFVDNRISTTTDSLIHLLNGNDLPLYAKDSVADDPSINNMLSLDATGKYFSLGKPARVADEDTDAEEKNHADFFTKHLFFFISHRKEIYEDSRMFLSPVPVQNGIAYTGTSGFRCPTLGIYMEYFEHCPKSAVLCEDGKVRFIWRFAGSPLTGSNSCSMVGSDGVAVPCKISDFIELWPKFIRINSRYDACKVNSVVYTLEEVYRRLKEADKPVDIMDSPEILGYKDALTYSEHWKSEYLKEIYKLKDEQKYVHFGSRAPELRELYHEASAKISQSKKEKKTLKDKRIDLKHKLRDGEIDSKTYQEDIMQINKRLEELETGADRWVSQRLEQFFPGCNYTYDDLRTYAIANL